MGTSVCVPVLCTHTHCGDAVSLYASDIKISGKTQHAIHYHLSGVTFKIQPDILETPFSSTEKKTLPLKVVQSSSFRLFFKGV